MTNGYYRTPTIHEDTVVFVCEDDLWSVPATGGIARRLTSNLGSASFPLLSPDGSLLAFAGSEEGPREVYVMPAVGGPIKRLTFLGDNRTRVINWSPDSRIVFSSSTGQPFHNLDTLNFINPDGTNLIQLNLGPASAISFKPREFTVSTEDTPQIAPGYGIVIGRNTDDPARWKRYHGGTTGKLWIDLNGDANFCELIQLAGNIASPMWIGERIFFLSDHEGIGNLYSCTFLGEDLQRHTDHEEFYARNASTDGRRIVYHAGADLYIYDPDLKTSRMIPVEYHSPQTQRNRKFVSTSNYLENWGLHPSGKAVAVTSRGKLFSFFNWDGAVIRHGERNGARYRLPVWLNDGKHLLAVTDLLGEERFVTYQADGSGSPQIFPEMDSGRPIRILANSEKDQIAFTNHRFELFVLHLADYRLQKIAQGVTGEIRGFDWSPDGEWLAYSLPVSHHITRILLWKAETGETFPVTQPVLHDVAPAFDPDGKYLYFLSYRSFNPVTDNLQFELGFPGGMKPYLVTLQKDELSPFMPVSNYSDIEANLPVEREDAADEPAEEEEPCSEDVPLDEAQNGKPDLETEPEPQQIEEEDQGKIRIDLEGIERRVAAFPVCEGLYGRIIGLENGKVLYTWYPVEGLECLEPAASTEQSRGILLSYNFETRKEEILVRGVSSFEVAMNTKTMILHSGRRLRVLSTNCKPVREGSETPGKESGWLDLGRVKVSVNPVAEWQQMFSEAWRLQRDHFWSEDMSRVDWLKVYQRYFPLIERISSRSEFSDLMWEMQGELGTSHAYEYGGDYRRVPVYRIGFLGADFSYAPDHEGWRIDHIVQGDSWDPTSDSPLNAPGVNVKEGDILLTVNSLRLSKMIPPGDALVNQANQDVNLTVLSQSGTPGSGTFEKRNITVRTLSSENPARYREWVEQNRARVHEATQGRVGYVHVPSMMPQGYAEFHRGFLSEVDRHGLIVDVRFNTGGYVSALILEKLARRRLGYDSSRWSQIPEPYPPKSVLGPLVALTNEYAGSDGDIFSHTLR